MANLPHAPPVPCLTAQARDSTDIQSKALAPQQPHIGVKYQTCPMSTTHSSPPPCNIQRPPTGPSSPKGAIPGTRADNLAGAFTVKGLGRGPFLKGIKNQANHP